MNTTKLLLGPDESDARRVAEGRQITKKGQTIMSNDSTTSTGEFRQDVPDCILPLGGFIGNVREITGEEGTPCPDYIPTKHELGLLARHWAHVKFDAEYLWAAYGCTGSREYRESVYARMRLNRIADLIGVAKVDDIMGEEFSKFPPLNGTDEDSSSEAAKRQNGDEQDLREAPQKNDCEAEQHANVVWHGHGDC